MRVTVNNEQGFEAQEVAFDGCHKLYLVEDSDAHKMMVEQCGYEESDFFDLKELPSLWEKSCPFRFISTARTLDRVIPQCVESASIRVSDDGVMIRYEE